jgi:pimeloyl-ACP methyl ester carboxylesterase
MRPPLESAQNVLLYPAPGRPMKHRLPVRKSPDQGGNSQADSRTVDCMPPPVLGYDRAGHGEPLLLLHGIGSARQDFAALLPALTKDFDVLTVDLPGHGASPSTLRIPSVSVLTDAIEADLDAHHIGRVHVLGNSLGARIAIELARRGRAKSVVAIAPPGLALPPERVYQAALMTAARLILRAGRKGIGPLSKTSAGRIPLLAGLRAQPWKTSREEALTLYHGFATASQFWTTLVFAIVLDIPQDLHKITCPVVLAQGTVDIVGCGQTPRYLLIPGSTFRLLPAGGHAPHSDTPDMLTRLVHEVTQAAR